MAESVAVISAIYGGYDQPRPQAEQDIPVEWIMVSDDRKLAPPKPWRLEVESPRYSDPIMAAKPYKMVPELPHDYVIWLDGAYEVTSPSFVREAIASINESGMAAFAHPRRDCIFEEAEASLGGREGQGGRYSRLPIRQQVNFYHHEGHPEHWGLWACGIIAWDMEWQRVIGERWLEECEEWGHQDQLSCPVVARRLGVRPGTFPLRQIEGKTRHCLVNRWTKLHPHL